MGKMTLFFDTIVNKVDAKARVSVPAAFRAVIEGQSADLIAFRSLTAPCIECCTSILMETIAGNIEDTTSIFSKKQDDLICLIYADAKVFTLDSTGRIALTEKLLRHSGIVDTAVFVGKGKTFQIWNPENYAEEEEKIRTKVGTNPLTLAQKLIKDIKE